MSKNTKTQAKQFSVTQQDVARRAGVSSAVVSYVINDGPRSVAEETKQRVLHAIKELGYQPNRYAPGLQTQITPSQQQLGIILGGGVDMLQQPYYGDILAGIYTEAYQQGQQIRFLHFFEELQNPSLFNQHVNVEEISALLFFVSEVSLNTPENQKVLQQILESVNNLVCLEQSVANLPAVIFDRAVAARTAVTHLIQLGHQRIGFVGCADERVTGYRQTLFEHGLPYDENYVKISRNFVEKGYEDMLQLLEVNPRPTAVFAANDEIAVGVLGALYDQNVRVPDEMAIVSIDDLPFAALLRPALTTVRVPRRQMGIQALRMLALQAAYPDTVPVSMVLPTELIVRQSCGANKS